ncbi:MSTP094 protein [Uncinocarpus reesii 1704]|uniref:mitogen-activated protein kinase n=1 Tax=Uncinocarpus reesii (strain UAMH 1704) TaxID=336963 RepID=C4JTX8_UNCRE|nr:MSTP094 protein [Uncinocarpus reesii 1704]EEP81075.1 MSTP094 protein [Uncinocarpus reesii 1704]
MERRRPSLHGSESSASPDYYPLHPPFSLPGHDDFDDENQGVDDIHGTSLATSSAPVNPINPANPAYRNSLALASPATYTPWTADLPRHSRTGSGGGSIASFERQHPSEMSERDLRPQRPSGPARTPSNTYAPPRRPPQFTAHSSSQLPYAGKRPTRRDPNAQYRAQEKAYVQRVRQGPPNEWFNFGTQIPGMPDIDLELEDESPSSETQFNDPYDIETNLVLENENIQPTLEELQNPKIRERLEWHSMLASVLNGDVVKQEKRRLIVTSAPKGLSDINGDVWYGIRAKLCGRPEPLQRKIVEHDRSQLGPVLEEIISFKIKDHHKRADSGEFTASCDAIISWHNTTRLINTQFAILQRWVGNEELNFTLPVTRPSHAAELADEGSFLDRIMKEDGLNSLQGDNSILDEFGRIRNKGMLDGIGDVIKKAKSTLIENYEAFAERHLPPYIEELLILISFPSRLIVEIIRVRLSYAKKMKDPGQQSPMLLDQMIVQFQILMKIAVDIKQRYLIISEPEPGWELPPCFEENFDTVVVDALKYYFKLLNWKLSANKNTFKEAEILEQEWDFSNEIGRQFEGGDIEVAEQFSTLTAKALQRLMLHFERELLSKPEEDAVESEKRYKQILDSVRVRQRKLFRFSRFLRERFENATEFHLKDDIVDTFSEALLATGHFLVTSLDAVGQKGVSLIASPSLFGRSKDIQSILGTSFRAEDVPEDPSNPYILVIRPEKPFRWSGKRMEVDLLEHPTDVRLGKLRLVADGSQQRLQDARTELTRLTGLEFDVTVEQRANLGRVNVELNKIKKTAWKLSNAIIDSVEIIRKQNQGAGNQELIQSCFAFATEFGKRSLMYMEPTRRSMNQGKLVRLGVDWVSFICDDCDAADRRTFKWAVAALEYAMAITHGHSILGLSDEDYCLLRVKVAGCMATLISHFDIMGARSTLAAKAEKLLLMAGKFDLSKSMDDAEAEGAVHEQRYQRVVELEEAIEASNSKRRPLGKVLEGVNEADRSLAVLSSSATNVTLRWQQGQFIGGGTSGSVYAAIDLDTSYLMAVKEIKLQEPSVIPGVAQQIRDEMAVLEVLDHPNIVSYRGIEVHRDKVYIFMEYCSGGSLATLLEHGRIEDETVIMVYALQMLEGLAYLHQAGIVHRDIKPANILLDHNGVIKYVDFGAAMIIARQGKTLKAMDQYGGNYKDANGVAKDHAQRKNQKSVTGTPMYMSPELVRGEVGQGDRHGSMDIWSLGCVLLEMATGLRPWAGIDNEWAIMYKIAQGNQPHLPTPDQLSEMGIDFIKRCFEIDAAKRPSAVELLQHDWIVTIRRQVVAEPQTPSSEGGSSHTSSSTSSRQNSSMF